MNQAQKLCICMPEDRYVKTAFQCACVCETMGLSIQKFENQGILWILLSYYACARQRKLCAVDWFPKCTWTCLEFGHFLTLAISALIVECRILVHVAFFEHIIPPYTISSIASDTGRPVCKRPQIRNLFWFTCVCEYYILYRYISRCAQISR